DDKVVRQSAPVEQATLKRAWYSAPASRFIAADPDAIIGQLSQGSDFSVDQTQVLAWLAEIDIMKTALRSLVESDSHFGPVVQKAYVFFEFVIPRMGRRVDLVLVAGPVIFAIEFKAGDSLFHQSGVEQVWDYALDL